MNPKRKGKRTGAVGLAEAFAKCPHPIPAPERQLRTDLVKGGPFGGNSSGIMNPRQLRAFAVRDPKAFREYIRGARDRELTARHLILNPEKVASASPEDVESLRKYIKDREWGSLYGHDRRMYRLLKAGMEKLRALEHSGLPLGQR